MLLEDLNPRGEPTGFLCSVTREFVEPSLPGGLGHGPSRSDEAAKGSQAREIGGNFPMSSDVVLCRFFPASGFVLG